MWGDTGGRPWEGRPLGGRPWGGRPWRGPCISQARQGVAGPQRRPLSMAAHPTHILPPHWIHMHRLAEDTCHMFWDAQAPGPGARNSVQLPARTLRSCLCCEAPTGSPELHPSSLCIAGWWGPPPELWEAPVRCGSWQTWGAVPYSSPALPCRAWSAHLCSRGRAKCWPCCPPGRQRRSAWPACSLTAQPFLLQNTLPARDEGWQPCWEEPRCPWCRGLPAGDPARAQTDSPGWHPGK